MASLRSIYSQRYTAVCILVVALAALAVVTPVSAKRGCSAFGHSCFGGHGKRSDLGTVGSAEEMPQQPPVLPLETLALTGGDGFNYYDSLVPPRGASNGRTLAQAINSMPPVIRQWLASYRRAAELNMD